MPEQAGASLQVPQENGYNRFFDALLYPRALQTARAVLGPELRDLVAADPESLWTLLWWHMHNKGDRVLFRLLRHSEAIPEDRLLKALLANQPPDPDLLAVLEELGYELDWYAALVTGRVEDLRRCIAADPPLLQGIGWASLLHLAVDLRRHACMRMLIEAGASVDAATPDNHNTPLHWAVSRTLDLEAVRILLAAGADPRLTVRWGQGAITMAEAASLAAALPLLRERAAALEAAAQPSMEDF